MNKKYVYIFLRKDISNEQLVVQSSHLAWELAKKHNVDYHPSMIVIGVENLVKLKKELEKFQQIGFELSLFHEPLINNDLTSFGFLIDNDKRVLLKKYQLLKVRGNCA